MSAALKIFIIYAREDKVYKDDLLKSLKLLQTQGLIEPWHDSDIKPGDEWDKEIKAHLRAADIILPIISFDFFDSDYIHRVEIVEAFERYDRGEALIIPIIADSCHWWDYPRLSQLQVLPAEGKPVDDWTDKKKSWASVYEGLKRVILEKKKDVPVSENHERLQKLRERANMVFVEGGTFYMGNDEKKHEKPSHKVNLKDFYIGKYPVTTDEYNAFCEVTGESKPPYFISGFDEFGRCPVVLVSWYDALRYCNWLSELHGFHPVYAVKKWKETDPIEFVAWVHEEAEVIKGANGYRLPTEAEWEFAARGGLRSKGFKFSGGNKLGIVGWYEKNAFEKTHPVSEKIANELGLYDMSGNAGEWCEDCWHKNYDGAPQDGRAWTSDKCSHHIYRGGNIYCSSNDCRITARYNSSLPRSGIGFRLARNA